MRVLALVTDAFGGQGGIALYNRDLLTALSSHPAIDEIVVVPRHVTEDPGAIPPRIAYRTSGADGKTAFTVACIGALGTRAFDLVLCGHMNLLPLGALASAISRRPLLLIVHGIEAWTPVRGVNRLALRRVDRCAAVSAFTRDRLASWSGRTLGCEVMPNAIHLDWYGPGAKAQALLDRYRLQGRRVIMTLGRLSSAERYKGFDEVLELLPDLARERADLAYLICGDGDDRRRLEQKASDLGVADRVVFAGYVAEREKADHYRLADAFVMPSRGEGFGYVFLEAQACGIPVVASTIDGSRESLRNSEIGWAVDPNDPAELKEAILRALAAPKGIVPTALDYFAYERFVERWHRLIDDIVSGSESNAS